MTTELEAMHVDRIRALSWPVRLRIVEALGSGPLAVDELARLVGVAPSTTARHAAALRTIGLLEATRDGTVQCYALADPEIAVACRLMRGVLLRRLARLAAVAAAAPGVEIPPHITGLRRPATQVTQA